MPAAPCSRPVKSNSRVTGSRCPPRVFLEFRRDGNRSHYEAIRNRRRNRLQDLVIAESLEGKGRFVDEIVNGIWLTCEETFWGVPAHLGAQKAGTGLPDAAEPIVDLFAAETASLLAWTHYLVAAPLAQVSPLVPERIRMEIDRRVLAPCLTRDDFGWMGFRRPAQQLESVDLFQLACLRPAHGARRDAPAGRSLQDRPLPRPLPQRLYR